MAGLTTSDVAMRVRRQFGDDDAAQIVDSDIMNWINDAQREICVQHDLMQTVVSSATVGSQSAYLLPANILRFRRAAYQGMALEGISANQADELIPTHDLTNAQGYPVGTPTHYWIYAATLNLWPAPANPGATDLIIYYTASIPDVTVLDDTLLVLPPEYHNTVVQYCMKQAYEFDANIQMLQLKTQEFQGDLDKLRGNQEWANQDVYPSITSVPEYEGIG